MINEIGIAKKKTYGLGNKSWVRLLTGGYWSQSLDHYVMYEMGKRAGLIKY